MASTDKDLYLKLGVSAVLRALGYTVFQEVDLCTYSYQPKYTRKQVTDFDVLGIRFEADFGLQIAVAECKSVEERAMENLLKLNGVKELFRAHKAYFVQKKIDINAREIGRELGIWVLDDENLATLMMGVGVAQTPHVDTERQVYHAKQRALGQQKADLGKVVDYLRYDFWTLPENRNIINLLRLTQQAVSQLRVIEKNHIVLAHQIATNLAVAILRLAGEVVRHNIDDVRDGALTRILGGPRERRDKEALSDTVARMIPDARLTTTPPFTEDLSELVARMINASRHAAGVVKCLDHMTRRLLDASVEAVYGKASDTYGERTTKLARDVLHFVVKNGGVHKDFFAASLYDSNPGEEGEGRVVELKGEQETSVNRNRSGSSGVGG